MSRSRDALIVAAAALVICGLGVVLARRDTAVEPEPLPLPSARSGAGGVSPPATRVRAPSLAPTSSTFAAPSELPAPIDLATCDRDLDLHGVVVTKDNAPVAGASLSAVTAPWSRAMQVNFEARD